MLESYGGKFYIAGYFILPVEFQSNIRQGLL